MCLASADSSKLLQIMLPIIDALDDPVLRPALHDALGDSSGPIAAIDGLFLSLPERPRSPAFLACFFNAWRSTHLKMLAIYALSCRLQRLAGQAEGDAALALLQAAALNAATSHEDLGLDYDGVTHSALYLDLAGAFLPDDRWTLEAHGLPEARAFSAWIYRNMAVAPIEVGLLTNLFSEVYNHAEYTLALHAFSSLIDRHHPLAPETRTKALTYIQAHVDDDTELDHFGVVRAAMARHQRAGGPAPTRAQATALFREYLHRLGEIMTLLSVRMEARA